MSTHTPPPWRWNGDMLVAGDRDRFTVLEPKEGTFWSELTGQDPPYLEISEGDRLMIEVAPELYEALQELWEAYLPQPQGGIPQHVVDRREAARAKARAVLRKVSP